MFDADATAVENIRPEEDAAELSDIDVDTILAENIADSEDIDAIAESFLDGDICDINFTQESLNLVLETTDVQTDANDRQTSFTENVECSAAVVTEGNEENERAVLAEPNDEANATPVSIPTDATEPGPSTSTIAGVQEQGDDNGDKPNDTLNSVDLFWMNLLDPSKPTPPVSVTRRKQIRRPRRTMSCVRKVLSRKMSLPSPSITRKNYMRKPSEEPEEGALSTPDQRHPFKKCQEELKLGKSDQKHLADKTQEQIEIAFPDPVQSSEEANKEEHFASLEQILSSSPLSDQTYKETPGSSNSGDQTMYSLRSSTGSSLQSIGSSRRSSVRIQQQRKSTESTSSNTGSVTRSKSIGIEQSSGACRTPSHDVKGEISSTPRRSTRVVTVCPSPSSSERRRSVRLRSLANSSADKFLTSPRSDVSSKSESRDERESSTSSANMTVFLLDGVKDNAVMRPPPVYRLPKLKKCWVYCERFNDDERFICKYQQQQLKQPDEIANLCFARRRNGLPPAVGSRKSERLNSSNDSVSGIPPPVIIRKTSNAISPTSNGPSAISSHIQLRTSTHCLLCDQECKGTQSYRYHKLTKHQEFIGETISVNRYLKRMTPKELRQLLYTCEICPSQHKTIDDWVHHKEITHPQLLLEPNPNRNEIGGVEESARQIIERILSTEPLASGKRLNNSTFSIQSSSPEFSGENTGSVLRTSRVTISSSEFSSPESGDKHLDLALQKGVLQMKKIRMAIKCINGNL
uniref:C2H2-type domain-containing protein n=1 Tax=Ditylenchus dipsaci TaxID=166011 RepID=A0A915E028_9BILA